VIEITIASGDDRRIASLPLTPEVANMAAQELTDMIGNSKATVSCSVSFADKDYGNGYEVRVSVSLTCNQDRDTVDRAAAQAQEIASVHLEQAKTMAEVMYGELSRK
jgi:3'-phosphoadenosine 5'-phosphosulfate sulfotransferase